MKKRTNIQEASDEMRPRYDFSKGKHTNHARRYEQGHEVRIHRADGTTTVTRVR